MTIREAVPADQSVIVEFNSRLADETEGKQLNRDLIESGVKALLADARKGRYWLAIIDGKVAGQIMVTYEWSDWRNGMLWWIQSVYIPSEFRRQGVFTALYRYVESLVKEDQNACGLRLYVETNNKQAKHTYRNLAMVEPGYIVMESLLPK